MKPTEPAEPSQVAKLGVIPLPVLLAVRWASMILMATISHGRMWPTISHP